MKLTLEGRRNHVRSLITLHVHLHRELPVRKPKPEVRKQKWPRSLVDCLIAQKPRFRLYFRLQVPSHRFTET